MSTQKHWKPEFDADYGNAGFTSGMVEIATKPGVNTWKPDLSHLDQNTGSSQNPDGSNPAQPGTKPTDPSQPGTDSTKPTTCVDTTKPNTGSESTKPGTDATKPSTGTQPGTDNTKPGTGTQQGTGNIKPSTGSNTSNPGADNTKPGTDNTKPTTGSNTDKPGPGTSTGTQQGATDAWNASSGKANSNGLVPSPARGGSGGQPFSDASSVTTPQATNITAVKINYSGGVDRIQVCYGGKWAEPHGGNAGLQGLKVETFYLQRGETIVSVQGRAGDKIDALQFATSTGRQSAVYGGEGGTSFTWSGKKLVYFSGRSGDQVDSLQSYWLNA